MSNRLAPGSGKSLTPQLIFTKTKSDSLHNIKNLNLWGNDLQDLSLIQKMPSLEVVSLSVNRISSLKYFANCNKLQELYLRKNNIADLREIRYLLKLPELKVLWLHDNPCAEVLYSNMQVEGYRSIVVKLLPNLMKLDNNPVTPEDRANSQSAVFNFGGNEESYRTEPQHHQQSYSQQYRNQAQQQKWQRPSTSQSNSAQKQPSYSPSSFYQQKNFSIPQPQSNPYQPDHKKNMSRKTPQSQPQSQLQPQPQQKSHNSHNSHNSQQYVNAEQNMNRNQNILMAILSLMRELDGGSLEIVRREADRMLE